MFPRIRWSVCPLVLFFAGCGSPVSEAPEIEVPKELDSEARHLDPKLIGIWRNDSDPREYWTFRADGTLRWFYQGVPAIGVADSIVSSTYRADPSQSPAHLDVIHRGVMGTSFYIYRASDDELRIGVGDGKTASVNRATDFGPLDRVCKRVASEPGKQ